MALNISQDSASDSAVRVIASRDDSIDPVSDLNAYRETLDESKLTFLPAKAPTVFICNFKFDAKASRIVNNAMLAAKDDSGKPTLSYGAWTQTVAKIALKDIQNPDYLPDGQKLVMRKDASGYVHDDLLATLERHGVVDDIFNAFIGLQGKRTKAGDAKNS